MNMKLFDQIDLGTESNEEKTAAAVIALDPAEMIATAEAMADIEKVDAEYQVAHEAINLADTVVASLAGQIEKEKALVATPEAVNASTVILSSETLAVTASILGAESAVVTVSQEAIEADPVESLKISTEAKESFMTKVIENIKLMVKKFIAMLKKLYTKIVVAMSGTAKQAEALVKQLKETKDAKAEIKLDDTLKGKLVAKLGAAVIELGKGNYDLNFGKEAGKFLTDTTLVTNSSKTISELAGKIQAEVKNFKDEVAKADLEKAIETITKDVKVDGVVRFNGMSVKTVTFVKPEVKEDTYTKDAAVKVLKGIMVKVESEAKKEEEFKSTVVKFDDLAGIVDAIVKPAKDVKSYMDKVQTAVKDVEKEIEKIAKEEDEAVLPVVRFGNVFISNVAMDLVLGNVGLIKGTLSTVNMLAKEATKEEKKEKEEK